MLDRCRWLVVIVCSSIGWSACGGGDGGAACGGVQKCGGDVVGDWKVVSSCLDFDFTGVTTDVGGDFCPQATVDVPKADLSGTASFRADLSYTLTETVAVTLTIGYPNDCLSGVTCAQFDAAIQDQVAANPDPAIQSFRCAAAGTVCSCTLVETPMTRSESGTYTTSGGTISYLGADGSSSSDDYCAQGGQLHIVSTDMPGTGPGTSEPRVTGAIVFGPQ